MPKPDDRETKKRRRKKAVGSLATASARASDRNIKNLSNKSLHELAQLSNERLTELGLPFAVRKRAQRVLESNPDEKKRRAEAAKEKE